MQHRLQSNRYLQGLCEREAFKDFMEYLASHYMQNMGICEDSQRGDEERLRALDRLKLIEELLNFLDEYKGKEND